MGWALQPPFVSHGLGIAWVEALAHLAHWTSTFCYSFSCNAYGPAGCLFCHIGPLGLLLPFLGFNGPFALPLSLINPMGLLAAIPAMLAHWVYSLFPLASLARLHCLYLLLISSGTKLLSDLGGAVAPSKFKKKKLLYI